MRLREDLSITLRDGTITRVPFEQVQDSARPACLACTEFANDYADIAIGTLGSPDGYATIFIRTEKGNRVYRGALRQGYIEERTFEDQGELRTEKTKMQARVISFARRKQRRGEARLKEIGFDAA